MVWIASNIDVVGRLIDSDIVYVHHVGKIELARKVEGEKEWTTSVSVTIFSASGLFSCAKETRR